MTISGGRSDRPQERDESDAAETASSPAPRTTRARSAKSGKRRLIALGGLVLVLLAVLAVLVVPRIIGDPGTSAAPTTAEPAPEPTAPDPIDRDTSTPLVAALPDQVNGYAVTAQEEDPEPLDADAVESWRLTYTSAEDAVTLRLAQWEEVEEATDVLTTLTDDLEPVDSGAVVVDGDEAGQYVVVEADGGARAIWTNATVVMIAEGSDVETVTEFYLSYPL
ncbi:hypothetical protein [Ruania halotolerans]|uniref:hypothetical protein n=1 Tax=Ruania halotolerans TaxID=2897773 RepID=UPI001E4A3D06|nr:hypothetical protein [Ruania halotolerans]UFU05837.1 hypothetical protein LQF10_15590 [Ruania halotolerans]